MTAPEQPDGLQDRDLQRRFQRVRDAVQAMSALPAGGVAAQATGYWRTALDDSRYLLDAGPAVVERLRRHCGFVTGVQSYDYRPDGPPERAAAIAEKLAVLRGLDVSDLFVPEARELGGFGVEIDGALVNLDTLRFYESLLAMDRGGALVPLRRGERRPVVMEIGPGWGGLAGALKRLFPDSTLVLVDLPQLFLLSATYLTTLFPDAKVAFATGPEALPAGSWAEHDFVFLPAALAGTLRPDHLDLAINTLSFQDMTAEQVSGWIATLAALDCPQLYSLNRRAPADPDAGAGVGDLHPLFEQAYWVNEVALLDGPFTDLGARAFKDKAGEQLGGAAPVDSSRPGQKAVSGGGPQDGSGYRHVVAWKKYRRS
ncbi:putative sugar O-methyltransferase [Tistlia consotensis]|uniref:Putative sugar O-methyltransferase n=1 Tax=Tistlia consotensis USBA 355 TaxID=560819 RepID=A0A1Y6B8Z6_9PROT|nr:putative sugar O-methyltransferase [Tistlia consotensis]SME99211.1 putative sugar O-methyltransferase [Tistlia consotensis USBA 355]SNR77267.1 putative sugar O-methyltransferase [Tistlia consotensis]